MQFGIKERASSHQILTLLERNSLSELGWLADQKCKELHPESFRTFIIDTNINYTNICKSKCKFCAFYREETDPSAYVLTKDEIIGKVDNAINLGATQLLIQGGLTGKLKIEYFEEIFKAIKSSYNISIHSLSPPEIIDIAESSSLSVEETLIRLKESGLDSLPGGGAELLVDSLRKNLSPNKCGYLEWIDVMRTASKIGLKATATMVFGFGEKLRDIVTHLERIRNLQDETNVFTAFIPWTYQSGNTALGGNTILSHLYLKVLAISRIYLDNIKNIQASNLTQGREITKLSLRFGANDIGGTLIEENVVASTGVRRKISFDGLVDIIKSAGFVAAQRTTQYDIIRYYK